MRLGCGIYRVQVHLRGVTDRAVAELEWTSLEWGRMLDDTSSAQVVVDGASGECCAAVAGIGTWSHELHVYRLAASDDGVAVGSDYRRVWSGPIIGRRATSAGVILQARDLSAWLDRRLIHGDHYFVGEDPATVFETYWNDAMGPDPVGRFTLDITPTGTVPDVEREVTEAQHRIAGEELRELGRTGIDWTVIDRVMLAGGEEVPTDPVASLLDSHFAEPPEVTDDGLQRANRWIVTGAGGGEAGDEVVGVASVAYSGVGLLEQVASEPAILDNASAQQAAQTRVERTADTQAFVDGGRLSPDAPWSIEAMVPGARVRLSLTASCIPVRRVQRLTSMTCRVGTDGEAIEVSLQPLGSSST